MPTEQSATTPRHVFVLAIVSLVLGVVGLALCWVPFLGMIVGVGALALGVLALNERPEAKRLPVAAVIICAIAVVCGLVLTLISFSSDDSSKDDAAPTATASAVTSEPEDAADSEDSDDPQQQLQQQLGEARDQLEEALDENRKEARDVYEQICDNYQVCPSADDPAVKYTDEYCTLITSVSKISDGDEQAKVARKLGSFGDSQSGYWNLIADTIEDPKSDPKNYPKELTKAFTLMVLDGYQACSD